MATEGPKPWQFKPGQSGNPSGRPKGANKLWAAALRSVNTADVRQIMEAQVLRAIRGDTKAATFVFDRLFGRPPQHTSVEDVTSGGTDHRVTLVGKLAPFLAAGEPDGVPGPTDTGGGDLAAL